MGLTGSETILIHSSMKAVGNVEGGADTVLDALMEFFADGLLLLPTHTWKTVNESNPVFDVSNSESCVGILTELFRKRPGVVRSLHPTHSIAAFGRNAESYIAGELSCNTPCTPGGCYDRLKDVDGKILLIGIDNSGNSHTVYMRKHYNASQPHISEDFVKLAQAYIDCGAARNVMFGDAPSVLCNARGIFNVTRHVLAPAPECFITEDVISSERWADFPGNEFSRE